MYRRKIEDLIKWKKSKNRKPLIFRGARQVGKTWLMKEFGKEYYENRYYKTNSDAQDAHEAIRPTYIDLLPNEIKESLTKDQFKLYQLIYNRFIASQMSAAIYDTISVDIHAGEYNFKANGQKLKFKGFMTLYVETKDNEEEEKETQLPNLNNNEELNTEKIDTKQSFTEPPPRYTEASLVKALEEKDIGRPSTYSPTITTILERRYIEKDRKQLVPTELGKVVNSLLIENFGDVINVDFTANIENQFDNVAEGKENWKNIIRDFYTPFAETIKKVEEELEHVKLEDEVSDVPCDKCGRLMVFKYGRYGKFLACPGYPECKNVKPIVEMIQEKCPKCGGNVIVKKTKRGKRFYVCENNAKGECDYISWNKPGTEPSNNDEAKKNTTKKRTTKKKNIKRKEG